MKKTKIKKDLSNRIKEIGSGSKIRGITLISLVITIIILLILAGITIIQLNNSGLFKNVKLAKERYQNAEEYEKIELSKNNNEISAYVAGNRSMYEDGYKKGYEDALKKVSGFLEGNIIETRKGFIVEK